MQMSSFAKIILKFLIKFVIRQFTHVHNVYQPVPTASHPCLLQPVTPPSCSYILPTLSSAMSPSLREGGTGDVFRAEPTADTYSLYLGQT